MEVTLLQCADNVSQNGGSVSAVDTHKTTMVYATSPSRRRTQDAWLMDEGEEVTVWGRQGPSSDSRRLTASDTHPGRLSVRVSMCGVCSSVCLCVCVCVCARVCNNLWQVGDGGWVALLFIR